LGWGEKRERERAQARLATRQHGVVAHRQLLALGFSEKAIKVRLESGRLEAIHRETYAVGHARVSRHGRWIAAVLAYGDMALLSHRSAASLWGLSRPRSHPIDVTAPRGRQGLKRRDGIWIHRGRLHPEDRDERAGIPATTVARTLFDFAEVATVEHLEQAWEEADRMRLLRLGEVERVCERGYGRRALKPIRRLLTAARGATRVRSPLEERFQQFCRFFDLPPHATNVEVLGSEVDLLWPGVKLIVELDSWEFHRHRAAFQRDRARDTRLLVAGYRTIRVTHDRLDREATALAAEIEQLLSTGG
jgi:very-short-patch-repair endonuclease/predicted transcriptional regulator of viral defense system